MDSKEFIDTFSITGQVQAAQPFGNGHINDTFRLKNEKADQPDYLLQRINHQVFTEVGCMMRNIRRVTEHVNAKLSGSTLQLIPTRSGADFHQDKQGFYWRVYVFRKDLHSIDVAETPAQIYEGAKAFGRFLCQLSDFPANELFQTLPDFHNIITRLNTFQQVVKADSMKRGKEAAPAIRYVLEIAQQMSAIQEAGEAGKIPLRVTHNDTKFNNVLLDDSGKGRCVIDLETVMPGYVHFDFGDGVRTTVSTAAEDEAELKNIQVDLERFKAYSQGYLEETRAILSPIEINYLPLSGALLAYLMGVRFLTDFLQGDSYYKTHFEGQNLQRARAQLDLTRKLLERLPDLKKIVQT